MRPNRSKAVRALVWQLERQRIAWMWSCDLPAEYLAHQEHYYPYWLSNLKGATPVILRGSREHRDNSREERSCAANAFMRRAAVRLKITSTNNHDADGRAIEAHASKRWPLVRSIHNFFHLRTGWRWEAGQEVRMDPVADEVAAAVSGDDDWELSRKRRAVASIARHLKEIARTEHEAELPL